jgi:hypothetical protein
VHHKPALKINQALLLTLLNHACIVDPSDTESHPKAAGESGQKRRRFYEQHSMA